MAGVHPEEAQTAHIGVGHNLESQSGEGCVVVGVAFFLLVRLGVDTLDGGDVHWGRHIIHNGVQQLLHALIPVSYTHLALTPVFMASS